MMELWKPEQQEFKKEELFAYIRSFGLQISDSLLQEFQEQGVMTTPRRRSRGRAKGNPGVWTLQQRNLLYSLCHARERQGLRSVAQRCNLPAWVWLYWGDGYGVTLDLVRRAMRTWASHQQNISRKESHKGAKLLVEQVGNQHDGGKQQAVREITDLFYNGRYAERVLGDSLHHVYDPNKKPNGPDDIPFTPKDVNALLRIRKEAVDMLAHGKDLPAMHWQWARFSHMYNLGQYIKEQPRYADEAAGGPVASLFEQETVERLVLSSCRDLATVLYIGHLNPSPTNLPEQLRLDYWKRRVKSATLTSRQVVSPLVLPKGLHPTYLEAVWTVNSESDGRHN